MDGDVAIVWDDERTQGDWQLTGNGGLLTAPQLETAVFVSLFTDARADESDPLPPGTTDRRGWWGNALGEPIGSKLWLLRRTARLPDTLQRARRMIEDALAWLVEDELAARIEVATEWAGASRMAASIVIHQGEGREAALKAEWAWQGI